MSDRHSDPYAELEVLGTLLNDPGGIVEAREGGVIRPGDFSDSRHRAIAEAMWTIDDHGGIVSVPSIASQLNQNGLLELIGGITYLHEIEEYVGSIGDASKRVVHAAQWRELTQLGGIIQTMAERDGITIEQAMDEAEERLYNIRTRGQGRLMTIGERLPQWHQSLRSGGSGWDTGISWFDELKMQIESNDYILVAGRPGDGKSSVVRFIAYKVAVEPRPEQRKGVYIGDFEEGFPQWTAKMISIMTGIDSALIGNGNLDDSQMELVARAVEHLQGAPLIIDSTSGLSVTQYRDRVRSAKRIFQGQFGIPLGFHSADYLTRMKSSENAPVARATAISNGMRDLCQEDQLNAPSISTAQLSRAPIGQDGRPREYQLSDLRESGAFEQDATAVIFVVRDWIYNRPSQVEVNQFPENRNINPEDEQWKAEVVRLKFAKHRGKPTGYTKRLAWRKWCGRYEEI